MEQVEQRVRLEYLAGMELTDKREKLAESELLVAKVIQVTRDQMASLEMLVKMVHWARKVKRVTVASLGNLVPLGLMVKEDRRVKEEILEIQVRQEKKDLRGLTACLDHVVKREGEETLEQREDKDLMGKKERRENEGHREAEADPGKTDSRAQRVTKDYQD